jgi:integrase
MATVKIILWKNSLNKEGKYPIKLRINLNNSKKYIGLNENVIPNQWSESIGRLHTKQTKKESNDKSITVHKNCIEINDFLSRQEIKAKEIIQEFDKNKIDWTLSQFEAAFLHRGKKGKVKSYFETLIKTLHDTDHTGNALRYESTLHMLGLFDKKINDRIFSEIDLTYVKAFDVFMQTPRVTTMVLKSGKVRSIQRKGCSGNTRKGYFRDLRAVLNRAIQDKEASQATYPFGMGGFVVAALEEETDKRYLPSAYLLKIKTTPSTKWENEYARKLFLFSYFTYGMSFTDMARLTSDNIKRFENGQYLVFKRQKTKNSKKSTSMKIKLTDELNAIILDLCNIMKPVENYILPIVTIEGYSGRALYNHIQGRLKKFDKYLIELAKELEINDIHITSYVSRHSMSMVLQGKDVPREVISQILGHKDLVTTNTYLDSFESSIIDEAVKVL